MSGGWGRDDIRRRICSIPPRPGSAEKNRGWRKDIRFGNSCIMSQWEYRWLGWVCPGGLPWFTGGLTRGWGVSWLSCPEVSHSPPPRCMFLTLSRGMTSVVNPTSHALTFSNTPIRSSIDGRSPPPVYSLEPGGPFSRTKRPQPQPQDNSVIVTRAPFHNECGSEGSSGHSQPSTRAPLPSRCSKRHRESSSTGSHVRPAR